MNTNRFAPSFVSSLRLNRNGIQHIFLYKHTHTHMRPHRPVCRSISKIIITKERKKWIKKKNETTLSTLPNAFRDSFALLLFKTMHICMYSRLLSFLLVQSIGAHFSCACFSLFGSSLVYTIHFIVMIVCRKQIDFGGKLPQNYFHKLAIETYDICIETREWGRDCAGE